MEVRDWFPVQTSEVQHEVPDQVNLDSETRYENVKSIVEDPNKYQEIVDNSVRINPFGENLECLTMLAKGDAHIPRDPREEPASQFRKRPQRVLSPRYWTTKLRKGVDHVIDVHQYEFFGDLMAIPEAIKAFFNTKPRSEFNADSPIVFLDQGDIAAHESTEEEYIYADEVNNAVIDESLKVLRTSASSDSITVHKDMLQGNHDQSELSRGLINYLEYLSGKKSGTPFVQEVGDYVILGLNTEYLNHDWQKNFDQALASDTNLSDDQKTIFQQLQMDVSAKQRDTINEYLNSDKKLIIMGHRPNEILSLEGLKESNVELISSGHTHHGRNPNLERKAGEVESFTNRSGKKVKIFNNGAPFFGDTGFEFDDQSLVLYYKIERGELIVDTINVTDFRKSNKDKFEAIDYPGVSLSNEQWRSGSGSASRTPV